MKYQIKRLQISCDGGAATGKSTGAKMISKRYKLKFLSSGLLYRYAGYLLLKNNPKNQLVFLKKKFKNFNYNSITKLDLHTQSISKISAEIAKKNKLRKILKTLQIKFANKNKKCCIEGRDISTKILPNSDIKFFFKCNLNVASRRRFKELKKRDNKIRIETVKKALRIRNNQDLNRRFSPLLKHRDAIEIDTGKLNKKSMLKKNVKTRRESIKNKIWQVSKS